MSVSIWFEQATKLRAMGIASDDRELGGAACYAANLIETLCHEVQVYRREELPQGWVVNGDGFQRFEGARLAAYVCKSDTSGDWLWASCLVPGRCGVLATPLASMMAAEADLRGSGHADD